MRKTDTNPRRNFLKKIPIAIVSISALSIFKLKKSTSYSEIKHNTLSKAEANDILKNENFPASKHLKPAPVPSIKRSITG